jgi:hypothetical protein
MELMIDAFNGGELTALQDAEEVLGKLMGYQVLWWTSRAAAAPPFMLRPFCILISLLMASCAILLSFGAVQKAMPALKCCYINPYQATVVSPAGGFAGEAGPSLCAW